MKKPKEGLKCLFCGVVKEFPPTIIAQGRKYCSRKCFEDAKKQEGWFKDRK